MMTERERDVRREALSRLKGLDYEEVFEDDLHDEGWTDDEIKNIFKEMKRILEKMI
jgi:hypothetical protein